MLPAGSLHPAVANAAMDKLALGGCSGRIRGSLPWGHLCRCSDFLFLLLKKQQHLEGRRRLEGGTSCGRGEGGGGGARVRTQDIPASRPCRGPYFVSSATSTSAGAVMGALECPAVGSSAFSSPLVELSACGGRGWGVM